MLTPTTISIAVGIVAAVIAISSGAPLSPAASGLSVITSGNTRTIRQADMNVTTTSGATPDKRAYQVTFSGYFNVTATILLDKNDTDNSKIDGKNWAISTAINFSALNGPLAMAFGNAGTHVTSNSGSGANDVSGNAMGGRVRVLNKTAVRMGGISGTVSNGGVVTGRAGDDTVRILAASDTGGNSAVHAAAAGTTSSGSKKSTRVEGAMRGAGGAMAAAGTAGQVFRGDTYAAGTLRKLTAENRKKMNATTAYVMANGYGRSDEGGGGNAAVAGAGSSARSHYEARQ